MKGNGKLKRIRQNELSEIAVLTVGGYIEFSTSDELDEILSRLINAGTFKIIIDLANVDYISSRGWSIFLSKIKEIRENKGDLKLIGLTEDVYEVYKVLEFFWFMKVYNSIDEAVEDFDHEVPPMPESGQT